MKWPEGFKLTTFKFEEGYACVVHHKDAQFNKTAIEQYGCSLSKKYINYKNPMRMFSDRRHILGFVQLEYDSFAKRYVTHSYIKTKYRKKGYGAKMYAHAISFILQKKKKVGSYWGMSEEACFMWKGKYLNSRYKIRKYGLAFVVQGKKNKC